MVSRLLLIYAVVELAAVIALVSTVGWGWTLLVVLGTFLLGWGVLAPMAGSHLVRQIGHLRSGLTGPHRAVSDGALVALAAVLVLVPGVVTTALGVLLLVPPVRAVARPGLAAIGARGLRRRAPRVDYVDYAPGGGYARGDFVDGEVVDVKDFEPPALRDDARGGYPGHPGWD
ncbi:membrane protein FxsA [Mycobacterium alsense]|uniref:FxsA family protein n=1 Tax=Mycobacterium alsense TaxID=324058 RepID=UPI00080226BF|nr:FxsA family protein [Mycobacterium alsense]OBI93248.1 membrane protein FxsA [Mycobacterium alsense]